MEEIIKKRDVPPLPRGVKIRMASRGAISGMKIEDISEAGISDLVERVRTGKYLSVMMAPDEDNEEGYLTLESSKELISCRSGTRRPRPPGPASTRIAWTLRRRPPSSPATDSRCSP